MKKDFLINWLFKTFSSKNCKVLLSNVVCMIFLYFLCNFVTRIGILLFESVTYFQVILMKLAFPQEFNCFYLTSNLHKILKSQISISQKQLMIKTHCFLQKNNWYLFFLVHINVLLLPSLVNWWSKVFTW